MADIVCNHEWLEWLYFRVGDEKEKMGRSRICKRCYAAQKNDEGEPRVVLMRMEESK